MLEKKTSLRLLYTINSSPQYILARSHTTVPVTLVPPECVGNGDNVQSIYASVLLKTCLNTICRSSPELIQDHGRDYSLYVLDPLESNSAPAPVRISNANREPSSTKPSSSSQQPRGVAVGLGLMSWALASDDSDPMTVVGTIVKQGTGQEALEVIFALRETIAMKQSAWTTSLENTHRPSSHQYSSQPVASSSRLHVDVAAPVTRPPPSEAHSHSHIADSTRETLASIHMRTKAKIKPPKKTLRRSTIPVTESDKLMNAETYIGPLKKKGRPKMTNLEANLAPQPVPPPSDSGTQEIIVIDESDSDSTPTLAGKNAQVKSNNIRTSASRDTNERNRATKPPITTPFSTGPLIRRAQSNGTHAFLQPKVEHHEPSLLDVLAYLSATSPSEPNAQNATILAALSSIDSSKGPALENTSNTGLVSALKHLLSLYSKSVNPELDPPQKPPTSPSYDDGIVILDKENINPSKFRKSEKDSRPRRVSDSSSTPSSGWHSTEQAFRPERHIQNSRSSTRSNDNPFDGSLLKESISKAGSGRSVRKRTLSDFMDEKESCRSRGKGKEQERRERRDGYRHSHLQRPEKAASNASLRHYPGFIASNQPRIEQPLSYYRTGMDPWSSPPRSRVTFQEPGGQTLGGVDTSRKLQSPKISASSPVRSVQAQQDARKRYVVPEWARTSTATQPRLSEDAQRALDEAEQKKKQERSLARKRLSIKSKSKSANTLKTEKQRSGEDHISSQKPQTPQRPIATTSSGPLFAATNISFPIFASARSSSPPLNTPSVPKTPKTPTRNRQLTRATPGGECESLFTPVVRSGSLFGSANSHSSRTTFPLTFTSPLGNRKKAKTVPESSILQAEGAILADAWSESKTKEAEQSGEDLNAALKQELEDAFDDLDCPPSSLPIASSDIDVDDPHPRAFEDLDVMDDDDETETRVVKPYWPGLPPSSPPPPSSPMMLPEASAFELQTDDEMDDLELPVATDSETDVDITALDTDISSPSESPAYCGDQNETTFATNDCSTYLPQQEHSPEAQDNPTLAMDIFEQFTNFNTGSDDLQGYVGGIVNSDLDAIFQNGLDGIDFTEFWETFKPLIDDHAKAHRDAVVNDGSEFEKDITMNSFENIDHAKLADDMQTLLSGCLM